MERLVGREDCGQQRAVYVRVYLCRGVLAFYGGEASDATSWLRKAEELRRRVAAHAHARYARPRRVDAVQPPCNRRTTAA